MSGRAGFDEIQIAIASNILAGARMSTARTLCGHLKTKRGLGRTANMSHSKDHLLIDKCQWSKR